MDLKNNVEKRLMQNGNAGIVQALTGLSASGMFLISGIHMGWLTSTLPLLQDEEFSAPALTSSECAWVAAFFQVGGTFGPILGQYLTNTIGRKTTMIISSIPNFLSFFLYLFGSNVFLLCLARLMVGISAGIAYTSVPCYVSEIASPSIRGLLSGLLMMLYGLGNNLEFLVIPWISFNLNIYICLTMAFANVVSLFFITESPYWFVMKGKDLKAQKAFEHLLQVWDVSKEVEETKESWNEQKKKKASLIDVVSSKNKTAVVISFGTLFVQAMGGGLPIMSYTIYLLNEVSFQAMPSNIGGAIIFTAFVVGTLLGSYLCDKLGRRPMYMVSTISCGLMTFICGMYFCLKILEYENLESLSLVPVTSLSLYMFGFGLGLGNLPYTFCAELFPTNHKALACCLMSVLGGAVGIVAVKGFQMIFDSAGMHIGLWFFSLLNFGGAAWGYFWVIETKGKSLTEIQKHLTVRS